jgi:hypothetical protein
MSSSASLPPKTGRRAGIAIDAGSAARTTAMGSGMIMIKIAGMIQMNRTAYSSCKVAKNAAKAVPLIGDHPFH